MQIEKIREANEKDGKHSNKQKHALTIESANNHSPISKTHNYVNQKHIHNPLS